MNNFFENLDFADTLGQIRDRGGIKIANVYTLVRGQTAQLMPFLPTPEVDYISHKESLESGGVQPVGDVLLKQIPVSRYSEDDLKTTTSEPSIKKYWVLDSPKSGPKAYITERITRGTFFWEVVLKRYKAVNMGELQTMLEAING